MGKNGIIAAVVIVLVLAGIVWLVNSGDSTPSDNGSTTPPVATPTPPGSPPAAPVAGAPVVSTNSQIAPSGNSAVVSGTVSPNGAMTSYWYEYGLIPSDTSKTASQNIGSGYVTRSAPGYITGLNPDTKYFFRLVAENSLGQVKGTQYAFQTTLGAPPVGSAPTTQTTAASGVSRTTANLNGRVNPNSAATTYWFEYGETTALGNVTASQSAGSGTALANASVSISDLQPLTKYYFRLNAQNQFGTVNGAILNFTTTGPAAPGRPSADTKAATSVATSTATLRGTVNPNGAATTYWFEYGVDSLLGNIIGNGTPRKSAGSGTADMSVTADISGLSRNTRYYFRVVAENAHGTERGDIQTFSTDR